MSQKYNNLKKIIFDYQSRGKYSFSINEIRQLLQINNNSLRIALSRQADKNQILSIRKGFYLIIPPEYSHTSILPPEMFIHNLMSFLKFNYYVGLMTAAMYHGASHQKPQEFFVIVEKIPLRTIEKNGVRINFITKKNLNPDGISQIKTTTGYMNISNPEMTFLDLLIYENRIGGINRAIEMMLEINDTLSITRFKRIVNNVPITVLQRAGYILENFLEKQNFADFIFNNLKNKLFYRTGLSLASKNTGNCSNRWKVIENVKLEIER